MSVWSTAAWNMFCLLKVRLFHFTPSIIQWCKHPLSITFCQMLFTARANGRKSGEERTNGRGGEKTDDNQSRRQMERGRARHWVRRKYPEWEVYGDIADYPALPLRGRICLGWTRYRGGTSGHINPKYSIQYLSSCAVWSLERQVSTQLELDCEFLNLLISTGVENRTQDSDSSYLHLYIYYILATPSYH